MSPHNPTNSPTTIQPTRTPASYRSPREQTTSQMLPGPWDNFSLSFLQRYASFDDTILGGSRQTIVPIVRVAGAVGGRMPPPVRPG